MTTQPSTTSPDNDKNGCSISHSSSLIIDPLETLADSVSSLWVSSDGSSASSWQISILDEPPTPLLFLREFVSLSRPCLIRNALASASKVSTTTDGSTAMLSPLLHDICQVILSGGLAADEDGKNEDEDDSADAAEDSRRTAAGDLTLTVAVTPDGHGDCLRTVADIGQVFVEPAEEKMTLSALAKKLSSSTTKKRRRPFKIVSAAEAAAKVFSRSTATTTTGRGDPNVDENDNDVDDDDGDVYYYSRQNDCLRTELPDHVWPNLHLPDTFAWAEAAFGTGPPDAVNLWMGNAAAVSSMHKDHYENLFVVLAGGEKIITLCPPADIAFLYEQPFPRGQFCRNTTDGATSGDGWTVQMYQDRPVDDDDDQQRLATNDPTTVQWIAADVTRRDDPSYLDQFPLLRHAHPVTVIVRPGELLYLPALWFHRVTQTAPTVAVNYWYDMRFDSPHWCYFHYLQTQAAATAAVKQEEK